MLVERGAALGTMLRREPLERIRKTSISDIVTAADHAAAEEEIVAALTALRPDDGILGEEGAARESRNGRQWIIDPIDGTTTMPTRSATGAVQCGCGTTMVACSARFDAS